jgi:hypothetical protein
VDYVGGDGMTDLERYALNDGGESSLNEGIEALVSDLERCQQDLATARENYTTARDNYRDSQCEIAAFYVTLATALDLPVETPAADLRALLWLALRERAALVSGLERVTAERDELRLALAASEARMSTARTAVDYLMEHIEISDDDVASYWVFDQIRQLRALIAADAEQEKA